MEVKTLGELAILVEGIKEQLHEKIGSLSDEMRANFTEVKNKQDVQNGRIRKLELWRSGIVGALAIANPIILLYLAKFIK